MAGSGRDCFNAGFRIEANAVAHSHPVLTLNTCHLDDDHKLLATFIHEQLHWGVTKLDKHTVTQLARVGSWWPMP